MQPAEQPGVVEAGEPLQAVPVRLGDLDGAVLGAVEAGLDRRGLQLPVAAADNSDNGHADGQFHGRHAATGTPRGFVADLASLTDVRDLAAQIDADVPRLDVLVNNAAVGFGALEQGGEATMRLITDPALDAVTGKFFDGLKTTRARPEAYDPQFRARLREVTDRMLEEVRT